MRIVLLCVSAERWDAKRFVNKFRQFPHGKDIIEAHMDCPAVPGTKYHLLLKGLFPGYAGGPCSSDMDSFSCREFLKGIGLQEEFPLGEGTETVPS